MNTLNVLTIASTNLVLQMLFGLCVLMGWHVHRWSTPGTPDKRLWARFAPELGTVIGALCTQPLLLGYADLNGWDMDYDCNIDARRPFLQAALLILMTLWTTFMVGLMLWSGRKYRRYHNSKLPECRRTMGRAPEWVAGWLVLTQAALLIYGAYLLGKAIGCAD